MKTIILIPLGSRTGGPEALHQLSDALLQQGQDAVVWYVMPSDIDGIKDLYSRGRFSEDTILDIGHRQSDIEDYKAYKTVTESRIQLSKEMCLVIPEVYIELVKYFDFCKNLVWWLSVDNAFGYLANGQVNLNYLRKKNCFHGYQSNYAKRFLDAINLRKNYALSDYTPKFNPNTPSRTKHSVSINAGGKVIFDVDTMARKIQEACECEIHLLRNMSRMQVYESLESSKLYIDLANFPGKDRMPREALLRGACVFVAASGAGHGIDFELPNEFIFDVNDIDMVAGAAKRVLNNYPFYLTLMQPAVDRVLREELIFQREVANIINAISNQK
jgi:hypothetical protein